MMRRNSIIAFHHVFIITFCATTLQKIFFADKDFDFFKATLSTLNNSSTQKKYFEKFVEDFAELGKKQN